MLTLVMYHMMCFTPFVPDLKVRFILGYTVCGLISLHIVVNLAIIGKAPIRDLRFKYRLNRAKKAYDKQRLELQKEWKERAPIRVQKRKDRKERLVRERDAREQASMLASSPEQAQTNVAEAEEVKAGKIVVELSEIKEESESHSESVKVD